METFCAMCFFAVGIWGVAYALSNMAAVSDARYARAKTPYQRALAGHKFVN